MWHRMTDQKGFALKRALEFGEQGYLSSDRSMLWQYHGPAATRPETHVLLWRKAEGFAPIYAGEFHPFRHDTPARLYGEQENLVLILPTAGVSILDIQREACLQALDRNGWSFSLAARMLQLTTRQLAQTMAFLGVTESDRTRYLSGGAIPQ